MRLICSRKLGNYCHRLKTQPQQSTHSLSKSTPRTSITCKASYFNLSQPRCIPRGTNNRFKRRPVSALMTRSKSPTSWCLGDCSQQSLAGCKTQTVVKCLKECRSSWPPCRFNRLIRPDLTFSHLYKPQSISISHSLRPQRNSQNWTSGKAKKRKIPTHLSLRLVFRWEACRHRRSSGITLRQVCHNTSRIHPSASLWLNRSSWRPWKRLKIKRQAKPPKL